MTTTHAAHTPGPWEIDSSEAEFEEGISRIIGANKLLIGKVFDTDLDDGAANASLISQAPAMVAVLKRALEDELGDDWQGEVRRVLRDAGVEL